MTTSQHRHSAWQDLLQILGSLCIIGFHVGLPFCQAGWVAVEWFFVMAGMRMVPSLYRESGGLSYAFARYKRMMPEVVFVWLVVSSFLLLGFGTSGMRWFLMSSPLALQNFSPFFFSYQLPRDSVFGPLWFVAALLQLQFGCYLCRSLLKSSPALRVMAFALILGTATRFLFGFLESHSLQISSRQANLLYTMPFCHLEAIVIGYLIGRGELKSLGSWLPGIAFLQCFAGVGLLFAAGRQSHWHDLGYEFPLRTGFSHVWGYPMLALFAGSLCCGHNPLRRLLKKLGVHETLRFWIGKAATLTFGAYCFHGMIIATGINGSRLLGDGTSARIGIFALTVAESFLLASLFSLFCRILGKLCTDSEAMTKHRSLKSS